MIQRVACHNGKCWEEKKGVYHFEELFRDGNIVDNIEKDLWKYEFYG